MDRCWLYGKCRMGKMMLAHEKSLVMESLSECCHYITNQKERSSWWIVLSRSCMYVCMSKMLAIRWVWRVARWNSPLAASNFIKLYMTIVVYRWHLDVFIAKICLAKLEIIWGCLVVLNNQDWLAKSCNWLVVLLVAVYLVLYLYFLHFLSLSLALRLYLSRSRFLSLYFYLYLSFARPLSLSL